MTLDELIADNCKLGRTIKMYVCADGLYRAEIRHAGGHVDMDVGKTPVKALTEATSRAHGRKGNENRPMNIQTVKGAENDADGMADASDETVDIFS